MAEATYDAIGRSYGRYRQPDPRIGAAIAEALGDAGRILNVGAGTGSYEPTDLPVVAVEPSMTMIRQRRPGGAPVLQGDALALPVKAGGFDAALAVLTVHHWADWRAGLRELRRIAPRRVVLTFDPTVHNELWLLRDYLPEALATPALSQMPSLDDVAAALGAAWIEPVPVPHDCLDGFGWAYWRRPERYLDAAAAQSISLLAQLPDELRERGLARLADDLRTGRWHERYQHLLDQDAIDGGFRLVVSDG